MPSALRERLAARRAEEADEARIRRDMERFWDGTARPVPPAPPPPRPAPEPPVAKRGRPPGHYGQSPRKGKPGTVLTSKASDGFGATLRAFRLRANLSMPALGERAGFDASYVQRLETGGRPPTPLAVNRLADALILDGEDRTRLLSRAFLPHGEAPITDPRLVRIGAVLRDPATPERTRETLADLLRVALLVAETGGRQP